MTRAQDRNRRALLHGRLGAAPALRPPWALDESRFVDACTGCGECIAACPERVLVAGAGGLPAFDPGHGECTFCGDCASACRFAAFGPVSAAPWTLRAHVDDRCLAMHGVVCSSCRDACGEAAIRFAPASGIALPEVLAERCTGCGGCVAVCPTTAIGLAQAQEETVDA